MTRLHRLRLTGNTSSLKCLGPCGRRSLGRSAPYLAVTCPPDRVPSPTGGHKGPNHTRDLARSHLRSLTCQTTSSAIILLLYLVRAYLASFVVLMNSYPKSSIIVLKLLR